MNLKGKPAKKIDVYRQSHMKSVSVNENEYIKIEGQKVKVEPISLYATDS